MPSGAALADTGSRSVLGGVSEGVGEGGVTSVSSHSDPG